MTTATPRSSACTALVGLVSVGLGFVLEGAPGGLGALLGTVLTTLVLGSGALAVEVVARVLPAASLLVALLTYTLQLVLVALLLVAVSTAPAVADRLSPEWFAGAVIACALGWTVAQVVVATRARIPAFDLPPDRTGDGAADGSEASSLPSATTAERGAR